MVIMGLGLWLYRPNLHWRKMAEDDYVDHSTGVGKLPCECQARATFSGNSWTSVQVMGYNSEIEFCLNRCAFSADQHFVALSLECIRGMYKRRPEMAVVAHFANSVTSMRPWFSRVPV